MTPPFKANHLRAYRFFAVFFAGAFFFAAFFAMC